ncbi:hypothetical protein DQ04_00601120 [Trypanosoma grayi]|uniref:hypothetical protein n=1 Tax=Trypanosoma grayi TaxID=71804 RepID=UPI0004F438CC|nr:hypothetical protein DQ04_00601120 [Trypanosoma grayi]KEG14145.1 hypothetical protein DQ04_00601120 [Trypanosoma grayi]
MFRYSRFALQKAFESHTTSVEDKSFKGKAKGELKKLLKIQLILVPIVVVWVMIMFPHPSAEEEKRLRAEYEKNAGWKT